MSQENSSNSTPKPYPEADSSLQTGKVAETASTAYATRTDTIKWRPSTRTIVGLAADDEVWAFVKANNLLPSLETAIRLVREIFPNLQEMKLAYEQDPELSFLDAVVVYAKAVGTVESLFDQETRYVRAFGRNIPYEDSHKIVMLLGVA
jgi:hypothetical protein